MALQGFGFVGEHYQDYSLRIGIEETRNLYPAIVASPTARTRVVLQNVPGLELINNLGSAHAPTAMLYDEGRLFVVSEGQFMETAYTGTHTVLGAVEQGPARIVSNGRQGHQVIVLSGGLGYVYDTQALTFLQITDPNFPARCRAIEYIEGVVVALDHDTGQFVVSDAFDATAYDGLAVAIRQLTSDKVIHIQELRGDLWLFGTKTIDAWRLTGNSVQVFDPIIGSSIKRGLRSPESVVNIAGGFAFLGDGEHGGMSVYHTEGYNAVQISTPAVDFRLRAYSNLQVNADQQRISRAATASAYGYEEAGHSFYVLNLPDLHTSMVYDFTTNLWHERNKWNTTLGQWEAHVGRCHVWAFDEHLIGAPGGIYRQALDLHTFAGEPRRWLRRAPHIGNGSVSTFHRRLHVDMEVGVGAPYGTTTDDAFDPRVMMRYSNDFGFNWSNERTVPIGKIGEYSTEVDFWQLGRSTGARVYEVSGAYPAKTVIADAMIDAQPGIF